MIVDERLVTYINSLDTGNTEILDEIEREALETYVPIVRKEMQSFLKLILSIKRPARILEVGTKPEGILVSDNVLQDGDIIESHFIVTRRNRTIYKRMREYLYELTHSDELVTSVLPIGDGITVSVKK